MQTDSRIVIDRALLRRLSNAASQALELTAEALHTDLVQSQTMPFDTGNLQNESTFVDTSHSASGTVSIVSDTPYARRLYFHPEYHFRKDENPGAGGAWFEPYLSGSKKGQTQKAFAEFYRQKGGT